MSRFAVVYEDPDYEYQDDEGDWTDVDTAPLSAIVDSWIRQTVAEKPQEELSPFATMNS
jgi:hypothetical protein